MLYPIELLGHMTRRMVAGSAVFVMHINLLAAAKYTQTQNDQHQGTSEAILTN